MSIPYGDEYSRAEVDRWIAEAQSYGIAPVGTIMHVGGCAACRQFRNTVRAERLRRAAAPPVEAVRAEPPKSLSQADIERRFTYHRPEGQKVDIHNDVRADFKLFAHLLARELPEGREKSLAFTALEEASFWAHAAVAREGK